MKDERLYLQYTRFFLIACATVVVPVVSLNTMFSIRSLGGGNVVLSASQWQEKTRGITYAPPFAPNRQFKMIRLFDRLPGVNTVVFGSSTAWGITQEMFPRGMTVYNFAQTGNQISTVITEADFLTRSSYRNLRFYVIPLDWATGSLYVALEPGRDDLTPPTVDTLQARKVPLYQQVQDALSLPRVKSLVELLISIVRGPDPLAGLYAILLRQYSDDYLCDDGTPAKDFDIIFRGKCVGFRYDGSYTYGDSEPVSARRAETLVANAIVASSKYAVSLIGSGGDPYRPILDRLSVIAAEMQKRGGRIILILPPLLPGLERALLEAPSTAIALRRTKQRLDVWAKEQKLTIIDAGPSERYGCSPEEFIDEHHPLPACYRRVFARYWGDARVRTSLGLWAVANGSE